LSSTLPLINIYVCTKFNFNPFCTFQDMARIGIYYEQECSYVTKYARIVVHK